MKKIRIDIQSENNTGLIGKIFDKNDINIAEEVQKKEGFVVVNLNVGSRGISPQDFISFIIDQHDSIAAGIISAFLYDLIKEGGKKILINSKQVSVDKEEIEKEIKKIKDEKTN